MLEEVPNPIPHFKLTLWLHLLTSLLFKLLASKPKSYAKRSPVFKWRSVEGRTHYPPSSECFDWSKGWVTDGFLFYEINKPIIKVCPNSLLLPSSLLVNVRLGTPLK